jgi:DNA adenine methylase
VHQVPPAYVGNMLIEASRQFELLEPQAPDYRDYDRPFLKWAGGKFGLLQRIYDALPEAKRLIDPFTGSVVVAINAPYSSVLAGDTNSHLTGLYNCLQTQPERLA